MTEDVNKATFPLCSLQQLVGRDGQLAETFARGMVERIGDGRGHACNGNLAGAARQYPSDRCKDLVGR